MKNICITIALLSALLSTSAKAEKWDVSLWGKRRAFTEHVEKLAELVKAKTNGDFILNISYGGLSKNTENLDGISIGAFQMAQFCAGYHADKNPSLTVLELPFLGIESLKEEARVSQAIYSHPAVKRDLSRWNATLLMPSPLPQYNVAGLGKAPKRLKDFKGLTIRATGGIGAAMKTVGAVPTSMSASEVRPSLDSGVIKAAAFAPHAHMSFGVIEKAKWWTSNLNPGSVNCPVVVNTEALESLSPEHRKALLSSVDAALDHYIDSYESKTMSRWWPLLEDKSIEKIVYSDNEIKAFKKAVANPAAEEWIANNKKRGLPAQELYDFVQSEIAK